MGREWTGKVRDMWEKHDMRHLVVLCLRIDPGAGSPWRFTIAPAGPKKDNGTSKLARRVSRPLSLRGIIVVSLGDDPADVANETLRDCLRSRVS